MKHVANNGCSLESRIESTGVRSLNIVDGAESYSSCLPIKQQMPANLL